MRMAETIRESEIVTLAGTKFSPGSEILTLLARQSPEIRGDTRVWMLNDSKLWYASQNQADAYLKVDSSEAYKKGMHNAEHACIQTNMNTIIGMMEPRVSFLDLGCGNANMTIGIVKSAESKGRDVVFYPVDISPRILSVAVQNAKSEGVKTRGLNGDFELLGELLNETQPERQRVFNLGANFVNFNSDHILGLISGVMRSSDLVYFSAQISNNHNVPEIVEQYRDNPGAKGMVFGTLAHVGFSPKDLEYNARFNEKTKEVEAYAVVKDLPEKLKGTGIKPGDEIVVITSYKPSLGDFESIAKKYFDGKLISDPEMTYFAFLGKKKKPGLRL